MLCSVLQGGLCPRQILLRRCSYATRKRPSYRLDTWRVPLTARKQCLLQDGSPRSSAYGVEGWRVQALSRSYGSYRRITSLRLQPESADGRNRTKRRADLHRRIPCTRREQPSV